MTNNFQTQFNTHNFNDEYENIFIGLSRRTSSRKANENNFEENMSMPASYSKPLSISSAKKNFV